MLRTRERAIPLRFLLLLLSTAARALAVDLSDAVVDVSFTGDNPPPPPRAGPAERSGRAGAERLLSDNLFNDAYANTLGWQSDGSTMNLPISGTRTLRTRENASSYIQVQLDTDGNLSLTAAGLDSVLSSNPGILTLYSPRFAGYDFSQASPSTDVLNVSFDTSTFTATIKLASTINTGATAILFKFGDPICFPASSTLRRLASGPSTTRGAPEEEAWETVAMPDLRVGDTVECLAREPVFGRNNATSAAYGRLGRCTVYGYRKALPAAADTAAPYTRVTFDDEPLAGASADGDAPAAGAVTMSANHHLLDPLTGQARQAGSLRAGDSVLRATPSGALVPARVRSVASVREGGAYVPLLGGGGLPIVDGVVAYPSSGESDVGLDAKHWGQHYLHAPLWQPLLAGDDGAEREASLPGTGRTLAELGAQAPVAAFTEKWHAVRAAAAREGRATCNWAAVAAEMHAAIAGQGKRYSEAEALAVLDRHHKAVPRRGVAEA